MATNVTCATTGFNAVCRVPFFGAAPPKVTSSCCTLRPNTTPFPEGKPIPGVIYGGLLWADMNAATPLGAWGRSMMSLAGKGVRCHPRRASHRDMRRLRHHIRVRCFAPQCFDLACTIGLRRFAPQGRGLACTIGLRRFAPQGCDLS